MFVTKSKYRLKNHPGKLKFLNVHRREEFGMKYVILKSHTI